MLLGLCAFASFDFTLVVFRFGSGLGQVRIVLGLFCTEASVGSRSERICTMLTHYPASEKFQLGIFVDDLERSLEDITMVVNERSVL